MVEERAGGHPPAVRTELAALLKRVTAGAVEQGAVFASLCSQTLEGRPLSASLLVSVTPDQGGGEPDLDALAARLRSPRDGTPVLLSVEELAAGPALRLQRRVTAEPAGGQQELGNWATTL
ncbi:MAG: hypothetical protein ACRD0K_07195 [Egibacteraceae bacterium]